MRKNRVVIMGAGGRDFHNFNVVFRGNRRYRVVAFTATQVPGIDRRTYPAELAGPGYARGIPIVPERDLTRLLVQKNVQEVVFAYSDVSHEHVMHRASEVLAAGADFWLLGPNATMLQARVPVVAVTAVRTGSGKSQTSRRVTDVLRSFGLRTVIVRHPMAYGNLVEQVCQRFATADDLDRFELTLEEREEYEPHLERGAVVYAGVDYACVLERAQAEADVIIWDGGNNDLPFYRPDVHIVVADPLRPDHGRLYHPGETNLRMADIVVINKVDSARPEDVAKVRLTVEELNPRAEIVEAASPISADKPDLITGRRVLVVEDGPTLTHGGMGYGAGIVAAKTYGAAAIVDPRGFAAGSLALIYNEFPTIGNVLPAMGYGRSQLSELEASIWAADCDVVVAATPVDLARIIRTDKPIVRVTYELEELTTPSLAELLALRLGLSAGTGSG